MPASQGQSSTSGNQVPLKTLIVGLRALESSSESHGNLKNQRGGRFFGGETFLVKTSNGKLEHQQELVRLHQDSTLHDHVQTCHHQVEQGDWVES